MEQITVLIADDHAIVRHGLHTFFDLQPDLLVVQEADSGEAVVRLAAEMVPDVVLMDLVMPGIGALRRSDRSSGQARRRRSLH